MLAQKTKQEVVSEFRCAEILRAARKVFAREGFEAATVDAIAAAAGLAKGTVYVYFHSKREIYLAALKAGAAALAEATKRNMDAAHTLSEKVKAFLSTQLWFAEKDRESIALYAEFSNGPTLCQREFKNFYWQQTRLLQEVFEEAALQGETRIANPEAAAFFVYELTRALITRRLMGWSRLGAEEEVPWLFDLICNGLGVPCSPPSREEAACTRSC